MIEDGGVGYGVGPAALWGMGLFAELITAEEVEVAGLGGDFDWLECLAEGGCIVFFDKEIFTVIRIVLISILNGKTFFVWFIQYWDPFFDYIIWSLFSNDFFFKYTIIVFLNFNKKGVLYGAY